LKEKAAAITAAFLIFRAEGLRVSFEAKRVRVKSFAKPMPSGKEVQNVLASPL